MVTKSKTKSNIIFYIICALLLIACVVLSTTGAWFTDSKSSSSSDSSVDFKFATFGDVEISFSGYTHLDSSGNAVTGRKNNDVILPGDKVTSTAVTITYDKDSTADTDKVFYLIKIDGANKYYVITNKVLTEVTTTQKAGLMTQGSANALTIDGSVVSVTIDGTTYNLDGGTSSKSIKNSAQGKKLTELGASYGGLTIGANGNTYKVAIIQAYNLTDSEAYAELKTLVDALA